MYAVYYRYTAAAGGTDFVIKEIKMKGINSGRLRAGSAARPFCAPRPFNTGAVFGFLALLTLIFGAGCSLEQPVQVESWKMGGQFSPTSRGNVYILPEASSGGPAEITVFFDNRKGLDFSLSFEGSVIPENRQVTARRIETDKAVISVLNAEHGDQFKLILNMKSEDGRKAYKPYAYLPLLICDAEAPANTASAGTLVSYGGASPETDGGI
jgi:hypothetical protein